MTANPRRVRARLPVWRIVFAGAAIAAVATSAATAQDKGTRNPKPLPPLANPDDPKTPAKELFGRRATAAPLQARSIGFYAKGCLAGAVALPINGKTWQVMRLSRNRNWGHPELIAFLEDLSKKGSKLGWPGLLVGDISQARGGRTEAARACEPSSRPRRRHLAHADAGARADAGRARRNVGDYGGRKEPQGRRPADLDPRPCRNHQGGGGESAGRAHLRQCRDQEGALPLD